MRHQLHALNVSNDLNKTKGLILLPNIISLFIPTCHKFVSSTTYNQMIYLIISNMRQARQLRHIFIKIY